MLQGAAQVTLNTRMTMTSVRTGGWARSHRRPSRIGWGFTPSGSGSLGGTSVRAMREIRMTPRLTQRICVRNGQNDPTANRNAPIGGPASWLPTRNPACMRALPTPRSTGLTSIGRSVEPAVSANTSATPYRNVVASTIHTVACPVTRNTTRARTTTARDPSAIITSIRRSW